jgi:hypothetical protein
MPVLHNRTPVTHLLLQPAIDAAFLGSLPLPEGVLAPSKEFVLRDGESLPSPDRRYLSEGIHSLATKLREAVPTRDENWVLSRRIPGDVRQRTAGEPLLLPAADNSFVSRVGKHLAVRL